MQALYSSENVSEQMHNIRMVHQVLPSGKASTNPRKKQSPPKPARSAFMCFTDCKKKEIMEQHGIHQVGKQFIVAKNVCAIFEVVTQHIHSSIMYRTTTTF